MSIGLIIIVIFNLLYKRKNIVEVENLYLSIKEDHILLSESFIGSRGAGNGFPGLIMSILISKYTKRCVYCILYL